MKTHSKAFVVLVFFLLIAFTCCISRGDSTDNSWQAKLSVPTARHGLGLAVVGGRIYAIGGYKEGSDALAVNEEYNPTTDSWVTKAPMPTPRSYFGIAVWANKIYIIGGEYYPGGSYFKETNRNEVYDPSTDRWTVLTPMPTNRSGLSANVVNDSIYLIGGRQTNQGGNDKNEMYNPLLDQWIEKAPLPTLAPDHASAVLDGKIYILGGSSGSTELDLNQIYDPANNTWSYGTIIPDPTAFGSAAAISGINCSKGIYLVGGRTGGVATNHNWFLNITDNNWVLATPMPTSRLGLGIAVLNDTLYAIGGTAQIITTVNESYVPIVPEFPSLLILTLFMLATLLAVIIYRKKGTKTRQSW